MDQRKPVNAKKIKIKLRGEADRQQTSLYLSKSILSDFRKACDPIAPSRILEELMQEFVESYRNEKTIKKSLKTKK